MFFSLLRKSVYRAGGRLMPPTVAEREQVVEPSLECWPLTRI